MLVVPMFPNNAEFREILDFCLKLNARDPAGFMELYEDNLKKYEKPGIAYEVTEQTYVQLLNRGRRYIDQESFLTAKTKYYNRWRK